MLLFEHAKRGHLNKNIIFPNQQLFDNSPLTRSFPSSPTHDTDDDESSLSLELAEL